VLGYALAMSFRAHMYFRRGAMAEAEADARAALDVATLHGWPLGLPTAVAFLVQTLIERGEPGLAQAALVDHGMAETVPEGPLFNAVLFSRGRLRADEGRLEDALADFMECGRRQREWGVRNPALLPWRSYAAVTLARLRRDDAARALADEEMELVQRFGATRAIGIALRNRGLVIGGEEGLAHLEQSANLLRGRAFVLDEARALVELGSALRRNNQRVNARRHLTRGLELAERCAADALAARARNELLTAGARPRRAHLAGASALTASERRAAIMAAAGRSNREIAQELFLTTKTIEMHLSNAYRKLNIRSRAQLEEALREA
jgi:DNA-binding CsgD family transcriptional regulator